MTQLFDVLCEEFEEEEPEEFPVVAKISRFCKAKLSKHEHDFKGSMVVSLAITYKA